MRISFLFLNRQSHRAPNDFRSLHSGAPSPSNLISLSDFVTSRLESLCIHGGGWGEGSIYVYTFLDFYDCHYPKLCEIETQLSLNPEAVSVQPAQDIGG